MASAMAMPACFAKSCAPLSVPVISGPRVQTRAALPVQQKGLNGRQLCLRETACRSRFVATSNRHKRLTVRAAADREASAPFVLKFDRLLCCVTDDNPYLSDNSRQALTAAADLAVKYKSKVTVCVIDPEDADLKGDATVRYDTIRFYLNQAGCHDFDLVERKGAPAAVLGDVADELTSSLVLVSGDSVRHDSHSVDGNLMAEFCPCPVLLIP
eukprot:jgi/Mesvir1/25493/Mv01751-RA.1